MAPLMRWLACASLLVCVGTVRQPGISAQAASQRVAMTSAAAGRTEVALVSSLFPAEVRLRKLHLVRPDLIPYPLDMEIVC